MPHDQNFRTLLRASERLSKPARAGVEADEAAAEGGERLVAAGPALVAPAAALVEPGQEPRDDPAVAVQAVAAFAAGAGDGDLDGARGPGRAAAGVVVARVDVAPVRRLAAPAVGLADGRDGVKQRLDDDRVGAGRPGQARGERETGPAPVKRAAPRGLGRLAGQ